MDHDPPEVPAASVRAVVIDTNAIGGEGNLDLKRLRRIADRLKPLSIPLWVPTQVVWEWAAHAAEAVQNHSRLWTAAGWLNAAGVEGMDFPPRPDWTREPTSNMARLFEEQFDTTIRALDNVTVLPPTGDAAIAALRDQVLGTGPGRTKNSVRTGAVDSAFVRDAIAYATSNPGTGRLVFLGRNQKDLIDTLTAIGYTTGQYVLVDSEHRLFTHTLAAPVPQPTPAPKTLPRPVPAPMPVDDGPHLALAHPRPAAVAQLITTHMQDMSADSPDGTWSGLITDFNTGEIAPRDGFDRIGGQLDAITSVEFVGVPELVGIRGVFIDDVERDTTSQAGSVYVSFTAILLATAAIDGYYLDQNGVTNMDQIAGREVLVEAPCSAQISISGEEVIEVHQSDTASMESAEARFSDTDDALWWVIDYLRSLEGVTVTAEGPEDNPPEALQIDGPQASAAAEIQRYAINPDDDSTIEWTVYFDALVSISCVYDDTSRIWADHDDDEFWQEPYELFSKTGRIHTQPYSAIAAIWSTLTRI